jgi:hypothetical protein
MYTSTIVGTPPPFQQSREGLLSTGHENIRAWNSMYAHAQYFTVSDELLLAILEAFVLQALNKQQKKNKLSCLYVHPTSLNHL